MNSIASRWISAFAALILLFGTLIFGGSDALVIVGSILVFLAMLEYASLFSKPSIWYFVFLFFGGMIYAVQVLAPDLVVPVLTMSFVAVAAVGVCLFSKLEPSEIIAQMQWALVGLIYAALLPALAVNMLYENGWPLLIFLLVTVFFGDVFAFFFGVYFGQKKIFPAISPKKTISGSLGGLLGSVLSGSVFLIYFSQLRDPLSILFLCLAIGVFAQLGDFFESLLKRISGKKDSGQIMPGHGGLLDRLDGVYFGSPVLYFCCVFYDLPSFF